MRVSFAYWFVSIVIFFLFAGDVLCQERHITIVVPSYNNSRWYKRNLDSIFSQKYSNFSVVYIDDCSQDGTADLVEEYVRERGVSNRLALVRNRVNAGSNTNIYNAIHLYCAEWDIVVIFDGDDWFLTDKALAIINNAYDNSHVWLTYGSYVDITYYSKHYDIPCFEIKSKQFRDNRRIPEFGGAFIPGHPLSFYAWLYKQIPLRKLFFGGRLARVSSDVLRCNFLFDMAVDHFKYIPSILYGHNVMSPIAEATLYFYDQVAVSGVARNDIPLRPLEQPPVTNIKRTSTTSLIVMNMKKVPLESIIKNVRHFVTGLNMLFDVNGSEVVVYSFNNDNSPVETGNLSELISFIKKYASDYVIYCTDDIAFTKSVAIDDCVNLLENTFAYYYCLLSFTNRVDLLRDIKIFSNLNHVNAYQLGYSAGLFASPVNTLMSLYRKKDFISQIINSDFSNAEALYASLGTGLAVDLKYEVGLF